MKMSDILFEALNLIVMICAAIFTAYVIPYVRKAVGDKKLQDIADWAERAVLFAQQTMTAESGADRKAYVLEYLTRYAHDYKIPITDEQINILIESAVKQLRMDEAKGQTIKISTTIADDDLK